MYMWEEAEIVSLLGMDVYAYGLFIAAGALSMMLLLSALSAKKQLPKGTAALTGVLSMLLGAFFSHLFYCLFSFSLGLPFSFKMLSLFTGGGHSMMGVLFGGFMGAAIAEKLLHIKAFRVMDIFAPAALGFVFFARLGEMTVPDFGISRSLVYEFSTKLPIAINGEYDSCFATYILEALAAVILLGILLRDVKKQQKEGNTFVLFLLLFGASQIILESLRYDRHISYSFIRIQQVMAILYLTGGLLMAAKRAGHGKGKIWLLLGMMVLISGIGIGLEFAIDRTEINRYLLYFIYVLLVAFPVYLGLKFQKKGA